MEEANLDREIRSIASALRAVLEQGVVDTTVMA
jgi:hypothetical protein